MARNGPRKLNSGSRRPAHRPHPSTRRSTRAKTDRANGRRAVDPGGRRGAQGGQAAWRGLAAWARVRVRACRPQQAAPPGGGRGGWAQRARRAGGAGRRLSGWPAGHKQCMHARHACLGPNAQCYYDDIQVPAPSDSACQSTAARRGCMVGLLGRAGQSMAGTCWSMPRLQAGRAHSSRQRCRHLRR